MKKPVKIISFPHMGNYFVAFRPLAELMGDQVLIPPAITKHTSNLGCQHSPESACIPFKYNLGNYIEALKKGATVLIQAGGGCRFGYYGEVQEEILKKLGYHFEMVKLTNSFNVFGIAQAMKRINPQMSYRRFFRALLLSFLKVRALDSIEDHIRKNIGFEKNKGSFERLQKKFIKQLDRANTPWAVRSARIKFTRVFKGIPVQKPAKPIRVGVVGELYVLMEPFSNFSLEKQLARHGIEVHRACNITSILSEIFSPNHGYLKGILREARPYLKNLIGAHGTETVGLAHRLIKQGFDGIIHVKPFGCMPEVSAMSALYRMSEDYKVPILYFSFDSQTSITGIKTRLEAFYDMLIMRRQKDHAKT